MYDRWIMKTLFFFLSELDLKAFQIKTTLSLILTQPLSLFLFGSKHLQGESDASQKHTTQLNFQLLNTYCIILLIIVIFII